MEGGRLRVVVAHGGSIDDNTVPTPGYIFLLGICSLHMFHCDTCISSYIRLAFSRTIYGRFLITAFINGFEEIWFGFDEMTTYMFSMYSFCKVGCG